MSFPRGTSQPLPVTEDDSMGKRVSNPPDAAALMTTARSFGNYDLAGAIADLLDNSITAGARSIEITCDYGRGHPEVRVRDDGKGMSAKELQLAMRPASVNPEHERATDDLGRFGWGMKSASFSQCKRLTVVSKTQEYYAGATWDLDDIDAWSMATYSSDEALGLLKDPIPTVTGTEIIWQECDRLSEDNSLTQGQFNEIVAHARRELSLVFHRYIAGVAGAPKLSVCVNHTPLDVVDPFYSQHPATQNLPPETIRVAEDAVVTMRAHTLPHYSKLTGDEYEQLGGVEGYIKNQGFYVYRNNRLIIHGTWFRLAKHGELSKLVRISVDIPNTLDSMWKITIDKSDAQLPSRLRKRMSVLVDSFRNRSTRVFKSKGGKIDATGRSSVWERYVRNQQILYRLNRSHPLLKAVNAKLSSEARSGVALMMRLIEQELPIDSVFSDASSNPQRLNQTPTDPKAFHDFVRATIPILLANGPSGAEAIETLQRTEPYATNWPTVQNYLAELGVI